MVRVRGKFTQQITAWSKKAGNNADDAFRIVAKEAYTLLLVRSPILTGAFRGNWRIGLGKKGAINQDLRADKADVSDATQGQAPTGQELGRLNAALEEAKFGDKISITNSLPYALKLERGYSKKAPTGVLKISYLALKAALPELLNLPKRNRK